MSSGQITLTSTSDTLEQVQAALGVTPEAAPLAPPVVAPPVETPPAIAEPDPGDGEDGDGEDEVIVAPTGQTPTPQQMGGQKKAKLQTRINELVKEREKAVGLSLAKDAELEALRARVKEMVAAPVAPRVETPAAPVAPVETPDPKPEDFATYELYQAALIDHRTSSQVAKQVAAAIAEFKQGLQQNAAQQQQQTAKETFESAKTAVVARHPDFDAVTQPYDAFPITNALAQALVHSGELGQETRYHLAQHPEELQRIVAMGETPQALLAIGMLQGAVKAQMTTPAAPIAPAAVVAPVVSAAPTRPVLVPTLAPDPLKPLGASPTAPTVKLDEANYANFKAIREQQLKAAGRRR